MPFVESNGIRWFTAKEITSLYGVTRQTVHRWVRDGKISNKDFQIVGEGGGKRSAEKTFVTH
jgi:predicted site-specific integrase-resolvase